MAYEQKDNSVALFHNDHRNNDKAPNYRGKGKVNGKEVQVSCWIRESNGKKYLSLSFQEPYKGGQSQQQEIQKPVDSYEGMDDSIPF